MSKDEEDMLADAIGVTADWGYPCDSNDIKDIVQNYLGRHGRTAPQFVNNRPGEAWSQFFLLRYKEKLSKRLSQSIKESRAKNFNMQIKKEDKRNVIRISWIQSDNKIDEELRKNGFDIVLLLNAAKTTEDPVPEAILKFISSKCKKVNRADIFAGSGEEEGDDDDQNEDLTSAKLLIGT
ncbi:hypothetical protein JTB14_009453 [Gonioctena quinquepunctata]|nr:hypothetical protein JTB14_009453 [Gonioctena quinquepunctata]